MNDRRAASQAAPGFSPVSVLKIFGMFRRPGRAEARPGLRGRPTIYLVVGLVLSLGLVMVSGQNQPTKKTPSKTKKSAAKKKSTSKKAVKKSASKSSTKAKKPAAPRGQLHPTPERYKQIEEALVARGYLLEEPTGKWGSNAVEALRSFQADHDLPATGRIDPLSLMQLGLGPSQ